MDYEDEIASMEVLMDRKGRPIPFPTNLYKRSPYPDNHTDKEYLSAMQLNPNVKVSSMEEAITFSARIVLQLCASVVFCIVYYHMRHEILTATLVQSGALLSSCFGYFIYFVLPKMRSGQSGFFQLIPKEHVRVTVLYFILAHQLAPVMRTLTFTVSTDTIHATAIGMIIIHLFTSDYGIAGFLRSKTLSANAAVIGSICLASRMTTDFESMALLTLAVEVFILFPRFCSCIWESTSSLILSVVIGSVSCGTFSSTAFLIYVILVFVLTVVIPFVYVICGQRYKNNIYGPWDEAQIKMRDDFDFHKETVSEHDDNTSQM